MNKNLLIGLGATFLIGASFYVGTRYAGNTIPSRASVTGAFGGGTRTGANRGGLVNGEIIAKDDHSITIKMQDGSTKIVFISNSTQVSKSVSGTLTDLANQVNVTANGTPNSDGSVTAQFIQIRPASSTQAFFQGRGQ